MNVKLILTRRLLAVMAILTFAVGMVGCDAEDMQSQLQDAYNNYQENNESKTVLSSKADSSKTSSDNSSKATSKSEDESKTSEKTPSSKSSKTEVSSESSKTENVSSQQSETEYDDNQNESISTEELDDFHDILVSQNSEPDVTVEFEPIIDTGFSAGNGTVTNPYMITTAEELVYLSEKINRGEMNNGGYFALGADIDMTDVKFSPIGNSSHRFSSCFDGRGFTVSNLTPELIYEDFGGNANYSCGFFGIVENAEIKNLRLENVNISYTYETNYFTEMGILAACVYPTRECKITDCVVNGNIQIETDILLVGGIVGDIFVNNGAKLYFERLQSNTKLQVRSFSANAGAVSGSLLGRGEESFSDICAKSEILHSSEYGAHIGAFGGVSKSKGNMSVSNCFFKINTNKKYEDYVHPLVGGIIDSYQPSGKFNFKNVFGFADGCDKLYEIPSQNPVTEENCGFTDVLPPSCGFNTEIWDITDLSAPFIKFNFENLR